MALGTFEVVKRLAPNARQYYLDVIQSGMCYSNSAITTPLRMTHFMVQTFHETGRFTILRENMNYSAEWMVEIFSVGKRSAAVTQAAAVSLTNEPDPIVEKLNRTRK